MKLTMDTLLEVTAMFFTFLQQVGMSNSIRDKFHEIANSDPAYAGKLQMDWWTIQGGVSLVLLIVGYLAAKLLREEKIEKRFIVGTIIFLALLHVFNVLTDAKHILSP